jgi:hypothetical protein
MVIAGDVPRFAVGATSAIAGAFALGLAAWWRTRRAAPKSGWLFSLNLQPAVSCTRKTIDVVPVGE